MKLGWFLRRESRQPGWRAVSEGQWQIVSALEGGALNHTQRVEGGVAEPELSPEFIAQHWH